FEEPLHAALCHEPFHERTVLELVQVLRCDAAADVHAAVCHDLEREVARLAAVESHEEVERLDTQGAGTALRRARDGGRRIPCPHLAREPRGFLPAAGVAQEAIDVAQTRARYEPLPAHVVELRR